MRDKYLHFTACFVATLLVAIATKSIIAGVAISFGLAIGKEYGDAKSPGNRWDWFDLLADGLGMLAALLLLFVLSLIRGLCY